MQCRGEKDGFAVMRLGGTWRRRQSSEHLAFALSMDLRPSSPSPKSWRESLGAAIARLGIKEKVVGAKIAVLFGIETTPKAALTELRSENTSDERSIPKNTPDSTRFSNWRRYGVNETWYNAKLARNRTGAARSVESPIQSSSNRKYFSITNHNHRCCGQRRCCDQCRRGLLCDRCNHSLERAESVPGWLDSVASYLARYPLA